MGRGPPPGAPAPRMAMCQSFMIAPSFGAANSRMGLYKGGSRFEADRSKRCERMRKRSRSRSRDRCYIIPNDPEDYEEKSDNDMEFGLFDSTDSLSRSRSMSRSMSRSASPQPKSKDPLEALIDLQLANGSFKYGSGLGFSEEELKKSCPESISNEVWITAIVIGILAKKFAKDKDLWELVANKAKNFVKTNLVKMDYDQLMMKVSEKL